jgi:hypothetical protein
VDGVVGGLVLTLLLLLLLLLLLTTIVIRRSLFGEARLEREKILIITSKPWSTPWGDRTNVSHGRCGADAYDVV